MVLNLSDLHTTCNLTRYTDQGTYKRTVKANPLHNHSINNMAQKYQ